MKATWKLKWQRNESQHRNMKAKMATKRNPKDSNEMRANSSEMKAKG
jgi:hypothetical protein